MENKSIQKADQGIKGLMANDVVKSKFAEILGKNAPAFISSVTTLATNSKLIDCEPKSVLSAAIAAASLDLQITPTLGFAAIIPYGKQAQFQIMTKGLVQLALRSGQFRTINVTEIYDGEMQNENRLTGEFDFTGERLSADERLRKVVIYVDRPDQKSWQKVFKDLRLRIWKLENKFRSDGTQNRLETFTIKIRAVVGRNAVGHYTRSGRDRS